MAHGGRPADQRFLIPVAAWQVEFVIVPRRALAVAPTPLTPAVLEETQWWTSAPFPKDYQRRLAPVGAPARTIAPGVESWGDELGNRVDVVVVDGRVSSARALVDVRRLDARFGATLLGFVRSSNAALVRTDGVVVEPTIAAYAAALRGSSAWRFANAGLLPP